MQDRARLLAVVLFLISTAPLAAQQPAWEVTLEPGSVTPSTITALNRCRTKHDFEISYQGPPFVRFPEATSFKVEPGRGETVPVLFDLTGMEPGNYDGIVVIACTDCAREPGCTQDRDLLPIVLTVADDSTASTAEPEGASPGSERETIADAPSSEAAPQGVSGAEAAGAAADTTVGKTPCEECVDSEARVAAARAAFDDAFDDPLDDLKRAIDAASAVGEATDAAGRAQAAVTAERVLEDLLRVSLERWDVWFADLEAMRRASWERNQGEITGYFERSEERSRERHREATAELREKVARQDARRQAAEAAAAAARQAKTGAQTGFQNALQAFIDALSKLRAAKDGYASAVVEEHCCFPCEWLREHWANLARLRDLVDLMREMIAAADQRAAGLLDQARANLDRLSAEAERVRGGLQDALAERESILEELRLTVREDPNCISLTPKPGWSHTNLLAKTGIRVSPGVGMAWRHDYKDEDFRVYYAPGCIRQLTQSVAWRKVESLNRRIAALRQRLFDLQQQSIAADQSATEASARVEGLEAERQALQLLLAALNMSRLETNTEAILERLGTLAEECMGRLREDVEAIRDARAERREAERDLGRAEGRRSAQDRRADRLRNRLDELDSEGGDGRDRSEHERISEALERMQRALGERTERPTPATTNTEPAPRTPNEAARQRRQAEEQAQRAREAADGTGTEADELQRELDELEESAAGLESRLKAWAEYRRALERYRRCLRAKQEALQALQRLQGERSGLQQLAASFREAADALEEGSGELDPLSNLGAPGAEQVQEQLDELAGVADRLGRATDILDGLVRNKELGPTERLDVIRKAYDELREWLPGIPGVDDVLDFYSSALEAVVEALGELEDRMTEAWVDLVVSGAADAEMAPSGIREEVRRLVEIHRLTRIITRDCGPLPRPPE